jgi:hypothetical protein
MFAYTFDNLAKVIDEFTEKVGLSKYALPGLWGTGRMPAGSKASGAGAAIVVQNGNAYDEGLDNPFGSRSRRNGASRPAERSATSSAISLLTMRPVGNTATG